MAYQVGTSAESAVLQGLQSAGPEAERHHHRQPAGRPRSPRRCKAARPTSGGALRTARRARSSGQNPEFAFHRPQGRRGHRSGAPLPHRQPEGPGRCLSGVSVVIGDYVQRLVRAPQRLSPTPHPDDWAQALYVGEYKLPISSRARKLLAAAGVTSFFLSLPGDLVPNRSRTWPTSTSRTGRSPRSSTVRQGVRLPLQRHRRPRCRPIAKVAS